MQWFGDQSNGNSQYKPQNYAGPSSNTSTANYPRQNNNLPFGQQANPMTSNYKSSKMQQYRGNDSLDMEFMMPPDVLSIDSDINKIGALTPSPFIDMQANRGRVASSQRGVAHCTLT